MLKATPGPWVLKVGPFGEHSIKAPDGKSVASVLQKRPEVTANARLIAAAPALLVKARQLAFVLRQANETNAFPGNDYTDFEKDVLELIAQVEGKS